MPPEKCALTAPHIGRWALSGRLSLIIPAINLIAWTRPAGGRVRPGISQPVKAAALAAPPADRQRHRAGSALVVHQDERQRYGVGNHRPGRSALCSSISGLPVFLAIKAFDTERAGLKAISRHALHVGRRVVGEPPAFEIAVIEQLVTKRAGLPRL